MNRYRFVTLSLVLGLGSFWNFQAQAQIVASDVASNYTGVSTGTNGGTGFGPWTVTTGTGGFAGVFVGNPAAAGLTVLPNPSFGMYANPNNAGAGVIASRSFSNALSVGQTFSVRWAVNWDADTGSKGFRLFSGGANGTQVAHIQQAGYPGNVTFQGATNAPVVSAITNYGTGPMTWSFTLSNATNLMVSSTARDGTTNVIFSTNLTVAAAPDAVHFYATNMTGSDNRQPYFNNLQISQGDGTPPVVTLSAHQRLIAIPVNGSYTADAGATATDDVSGDVTASLIHDASTAVNLAQAGTYTVTYSATDAVGNIGTASQTVVVHAVGTYASLYNSMAAPGTYAFSGAWTNNGSNNTAMTKTANFQWVLNRHMTNRGSFILKFVANGDWGLQWGSSSTAGTALLNGGDVGFQVPITGIYNISFNENTLAYSVARANTNGLTYDQWAALYGLAAGSESENADFDNGNGDFLTNLEEFQANTDPLNKDTDADGLFDDEEVKGLYAVHVFFDGNFLNPLSGDTDGDGLPDSWELANGLDGTDNGSKDPYMDYTGLTGAGNPNGPDGDPDGDSLSNAQEFAANSNPRAVGSGFIRSSTSIHITGGFTTPSWTAAPASRALDMVVVGNFTWRGLVYWGDTNAPTDKNFKFISDDTWDKQWGTNNATAAGFAVRKDQQAGGITSDPGPLVASALSAKGYYVFELNEYTGAYSIATLPAADSDEDGLPDAWESFYGAQLSSPTANLDPTADSNGDGQSNLAEFANGGNPVLDLVFPTLALAPGIPVLTWVAVGGEAPAIGAADVVVSDDVSSGLTPTITLRKITGVSPGVNAFNSTESSRWRVDYSVQDEAGNTVSLSRTILVGDEPPGWQAVNWPPTMTIHTLSSGDVYGQIFVQDATSGAGAAPAIQAWVGLNSANTDPATWDASAWSIATFNAQQFANDEYKGTVSGVGLTPGTPYYYAYRWQIGSGAYTYGGIKADGSGAGPWDGTTNGNGVLTVQAARQVTFAVDMNVQIFKGEFNPAVNGVEVRGDFNGFSGGAALSDADADGIYTGTFAVGGAENAEHSHKFVITGPGNATEWEFDIGTPPGNRKTTLLANGTAINLPAVFFSGISETRKISISVDMSKQIEKLNFNAASNAVSVISSVTSWTPPGAVLAPAPGLGANVYSLDLFVDGPLPDSVEYKFYNNAAGAPNAGYEGGANRTVLKVDIGAANLSATTIPTVFFGNDDGLYPTDISLSASSIDENNAVNDVIGTLSATDPSLGDAFTFELVSGAGDADNAAFNISGASLRASSVFDRETKASYSIRVRVTDRSAASFEESFTITITDVSEGPTFGTAYAGKELTNRAANGLTYLVNYAFGGSDTTEPKLPSLDTSDTNKLALVAFIRTNNAVGTLQVKGEKADSLGNWDTNNPILGEAAVDQTGAPEGTQKQIFSTPKSGDRQFLRLKATLAP